VIGEGSFGVVRMAQWRGMTVAVKTLKVGPELGHSSVVTGDACDAGGDGVDDEAASSTEQSDLESTLQELSHEAHVMARVCSHDHIVHFIGVLLKPKAAIVTAFMELGSLEDVLVHPGLRHRRQEFTYKDLVRLCAQAAAGVLHLHQENVVHRDIAARNCLLDASMCVRVADFGFSRLRTNNQARGVTKSTTGPVKWMAPEAIRRRMYSSASDVFSFGVLLFEVFSGTPPWQGVDNTDVMFRVCSGERILLDENLFPKDIRSLIVSCWQQNPQERPNIRSVHDILLAQLYEVPVPSLQLPSRVVLSTAYDSVKP
jgi:serine/threonine protein kinase